MDDNDLDQALHSLGAQWREENRRVAGAAFVPPRRVRTGYLLPAGIAAAVAVILVGALVIGGVFSNGATPSRKPTPAGPKPPPSPAGHGPTSIPLTRQGAFATAIGPDDIAITYDGVSGRDGVVEIRDRNQPTRIPLTFKTQFSKGGSISCPWLGAGWLVYTDIEMVPTQLSPGPPNRWALMAVNLQTHATRTLATGMTDMASEYACAQGRETSIAWTSGSGKAITVLNLATDRRRILNIAAAPQAFLASGLLVTDANTRRGEMKVSLVDPETGASTPVVTVPKGLEVEAAGNRVVWWASNPAANEGLTDSYDVATCTLPRCADVTKLYAADNEGNGTVGNTFAAWNPNGPDVKGNPYLTVVDFSGRPIDVPADAEVAFATVKAQGSLLVFVTRTDVATSQEKDTLHLVTIH
jgi:hypothetical protein